MRFKKRNKNKVPKSIIDIHGGDATLAEQTVLDTTLEWVMVKH